MTNFYFNLNQIQSNPDGEPTVNRQSRLMSLRGKKAEKEQLSRDCLSLASELPLTYPRPDSLSLVSRQSDLDQVRAVSVGLSARVWKHVAMIFAVLVMSMANIGTAWGASPLAVETPDAPYYTQDGVTVFGENTTGKMKNSSSQKCYNTNNASVIVFSELTNITGISFDMCLAGDGSGEGNAISLYTSTGGVFAVPSSGFTATKGGSALGSLTNIQAIKANQSSLTSISVTFDSPVKGIELKKAASTNIRNIVVTYNNTTLPSVYFKATTTSTADVANVETTPSGGSMTVDTKTTKKTINSIDYYQAESGGQTINLGTGNTFQAGDQIVLEFCGSGNNKTVGPIIQKTTNCTISVTVNDKVPAKVAYIVSAGDGIQGQTSATIIRTSSDLYIRSFSVLRAAAGGTDSYDIHIGKNNDNYTDENLTNTSGTTWSKTITLDGGSYYEFKVKKTPSAGDAVWYGNNGKITASVASWTFSTGTDNCKLYTSVAGSYTFSWDASNNKLSVTYPAGEHPTKRIYMACGSTWCDASPKFFVHSWGVTEYNTQVQESTCDGYYADIIWYNDYFQFTRNASDATAYNNGSWTNYSENLTYNSSQTKWTCTGWSDGKGTFSSSAYSPTTYTISYAKGGTTATGGAAISGSKANESKTCGVDFTLPSSAVFTATGYTQTGWTTSDGGAQTHALGGSYTDNAAQTFYPVWTANQYTVTHTLDGVTKSSGATGANAATYGTNYTAVFAASSGYALPETITVTIGGSTKTAGTEYTWDKASGTVTITGSYITGNIVITITGESDDPCSEPAEVTNEIARFFVPCGTGTIKYEVTNQNASTGDNTFTTYKVGSTSADNWYVDATSGLRYGKLTANDSYISLKLSVGSFQAGDVVNLYVNCNNATKTGLKLKNQSTGNTVSVSSTAAKVEASGTYTLVAADIEADGSIKFFRENSSTFVNRIIITRPACTNVSITTQPTTPVAATVGSACSITGLVAAGTSPTYKWYTCNSDGSGATEITSAGAMSFTGYTTATLGLTPTATGATYYKCVVSGSCGDPVTSSVVTVNASAAAVLTAIEADVLYQAADMANITFTGSDQNFTGLSTNNLFKVYGTDGNAAKGKNENHDVTDDISTKSFTSALYILSNSNTTSTSDPTQGAIEIITPSIAGLLYLYLDANNSSLTLKKQGTSTSTSLSGAAYKAMPVDANTHYFINGATSGKRGLYGIQYVSTYSVSITPTNVTKETGATGAGAAIKGKAYTATFTAPVGYTLPSDVTSLTIGGTPATKGTEYTWSVSDGTGTLTVKAANVTGNIAITVTGAAAATYALTYNCNGAESGCPSNTTASALPNPLPSAPTKDGYTFGGWYTDEELTVSAVAGATMTGATTLYAKWTERGSECEDTPHAWTVVATGAKSYKVRISKVTEEVAIPVADATASNLTAYAGSVSTNDNVTVQIADGGSSQYGYKFDGSNTYLKLVFSTPLVLNDTLVVGMTNASHNISFTTTAARATTLSTSGGKLIIPAALAGQSTLYLWRGSGSTMYMKSLAVKHACDALPSCTPPTLPTLSNQSLCEGNDIAEWDATPTNASTITGKEESVSYSWKKKGSETVLGTSATLDLGASAAESQAGTYVVTVTVSKTGYASSTATKEVTLSVTDGIEVTGITADKATVYPTNSVTLTATASADATWQWYTCTNAEGDSESSIGGATSASYTITAPASAGTYYYKVKATGSCGNAERVYTLIVSAAAGGDCFHYVSVLPDKDISPSSGANIVTPTHATTLEGGTMKVGSQQITITKNGLKLENSKSVSITLDAALEAGNVVIVKGTAASAGNGVSINGVNFYDEDNKSFDVSYTVLADDGLVGKTSLTVTKYSGSSYLQEIKITGCGTACTDPEVTASVNNSTACVGTSVTFSATGAHASATYQWQKYSGGAWTNIASATAATYNIASVATTDAMKYRVIASHECNRTSNEVTLNVPVAPVFADFTATRSVMATLALSITDVEASDATSYAWYKSANATYDAGTDTKVGTTQELLLASGGEAAGSTYYLFCVASNSCGSTTSSAITVNVTAFIEEDCATKGSEGAADFGFNYESGIGSGNAPNTSIPCWKSQGKAAYLTYTAPDGKYFSRVTMNVLVSSGSKAAYGYSTDGGTTWTYADLTGLTSSLADKSLTLSANVNAFRVGRNFDPSYGVTSGTFYLSKICFEYTDACTATTVTPDATSKTHTIGESFTAPIFTLAPGAVSSGTLTYSSSDEEIASVDESGNVTFNGTAGTVTITAAYAGATIADVDYCASEGSYTITVSCEGGAPKVVADGSVNMSGCNSSVTLNAKKQDGKTDFTGGSYQWFRNGEEIAGATGKSYTASQTGVYTVAYTSAGGCTSLSTNNATVTSATVEPEVTKLVPFHYYHVDKTYTAQMKDRHLFSVKGSAAYGSTGKNFKLTMSRNGGAETDMTTAASIWVKRSDDGQVDSVMIDLNKLSDKYSEGDELVLTCAAVDCSGNVSAVYKDEITINVIGATPTLALICSGTDIAAGTRDTKKLTVGGDFLTGYNVADLCQQTGEKSFDANTEWGLYTRLKENYIVTPVNGYAVFNKLNYEPFDILLLTDYPKASKSNAAKDVLDDMAALCDYRPMLSFKTHMVAKSPSKWAAKGFTTSATENKADGKLNLNIVCYAHPMFESIKEGENVYDDVANSSAPLVYTMLTDVGHEGKKGMQGFELAAAENFVTIGLTHYNASISKNDPLPGEVTWTPGTEDRMLVTVAERQTNIEARFILFSLNCGAQSMLTEKGRTVVLKCLEYLLDDNPLHVADCSFTFDNGKSNEHDASWYSSNCPSCTGTKGDGKWSTAANWGPDYRLLPGEFTSVRIKEPVEVDMEHAHVMSVRILEDGQITIPAGKALDVKSTIRRMDGSEIYPTDVNDIHIGSASTGNGTLIFNNNTGDTKAQVDMYSTAKADMETMSAATSTWQYIGTPHNDVASATRNYYDSWLYQYYTPDQNWVVIPNGGPLEPFRGYCVTHPAAPVVYDMSGTLVATTSADIDVPANKYVVAANSWVAPIDINAITDDDMENISDKAIYFFNTGSDPDKSGTVTENATGDARWAAGTYVTIPINSAPYTGTDDHIPSMQGFYVWSTTAGTLHLNYEKHVRGTTRDNILSGPMHAPKRVQAEDNAPEVLWLVARGNHYDDRLVVLEREDFTRNYESGWDGEAWGGSDLSPMVYITNEAGVDEAVSAIPEFEGTVITFRAGEDSEYRFEFTYSEDAEPLYLFDTENNTYTQIMTGNAYYFTTSDKAPHSRFILTRKAPQIATGTELTSDGEGANAKKLLIEDKMYILLNGMLYDATGKVVK